jgi:hypothetical protein
MIKRMRISRVGLVGALLASSFVAGCAMEDSPEETLSVQGSELQQRVDKVLASIPGGHQVSATEIDYDGLTATVDPTYAAGTSAISPAAIACGSGHFCIIVSGTAFDFFACRRWDLSNWTGIAPFNNNQTGHAVAQAFNQDSTKVVFANAAVSSGTVNVAPWWHFQPCGN